MAKTPRSDESSSPFSSAQSFTETIKTDFLLLGAFLLFLGLISTDAYYRAFGLRFQFLTYPWNLIIFRGMLTIVRFPLLWILIILMVAVIQVDRYLTKSTNFKRHGWRITFLYLFTALVVCCMPRLGTYIGSAEATRDMTWDDTTLPRIYKIVNSDSSDEPCDHCVLLMLDSSQAAYFEALNKGDNNDLPRTKIRSRSTISSIETTR